MTRLRTHNRRKLRKTRRLDFARRFFRDLYAAWAAHGPEAIRRAVEADPEKAKALAAKLVDNPLNRV